MRKMLALLVLASPLGQAFPAGAQSVTQPQPGVVETQANPVGAGADTFIPPDPATANAPVGAAMPSDPGYHGGAYTGALTTAPQAAMDQVYPQCTARLHDHCTNPGQAGNRVKLPHHTAAKTPLD